MEVNLFFVFLSLVCIILVAYLIWLDHRNMRMVKLRVKKLHASPMFAEMVPLLKTAQKRAIEQLLVDKTGVIIRYLEPVGSESRFLVRERGYRYLTPEKQEALLILLEEFLPRMMDSHRYSFHKKHIRLINGKREVCYQYTILNSYKATLIRAPYYNSALQHLWQ